LEKEKKKAVKKTTVCIYTSLRVARYELSRNRWIRVCIYNADTASERLPNLASGRPETPRKGRLHAFAAGKK
jgi:hypothetical protein